MIIDRFLHQYDVRERHAIVIAADAATVDACTRNLDLRGSRIARLLFRLRGMRGDALGLDGLRRMGFSVLADVPGEELVLGLIGRFWTPSGGLCRFDAPDFVAFDEPGWAKAAWNFGLTPTPDGRVRLTTETRVRCTDAASRRRFRAYWLVVRPFSGLIRRIVLREIRRQAESSAMKKGGAP